MAVTKRNSHFDVFKVTTDSVQLSDTTSSFAFDQHIAAVNTAAETHRSRDSFERIVIKVLAGVVDKNDRYAKLGGEMISLTAVELRIAETNVLDGSEFAVTAVPDSSKGERIVLLVKGAHDTEDISRDLRKSGMPPLMLPGSVFCVDEIPTLGSGKWDFPGMKKLAQELVDNKSRAR